MLMERPMRGIRPIVSTAALALAALSCGSPQDSSTADAGVPGILFIKRQHTFTDPASGAVSVDVAGGNGQVLDYDRYVPGGALMLLSPARADGTLHTLT